MTITTPAKLIEPEALAQNDDSDLHHDETGENTGEDTVLAKEDKVKGQKKKDDSSSNQNQGPANENL